MAAEEQTQTKRGLHPNSRAALEATKFKPGQSGNPSGRPKNVLSKAIRKKLEEVDEGGKSVAEQITDKLIELALAGNMEAIKLLGDRSEGRPRQSLTVTTDGREQAEGRAARLMERARERNESLTRVQALGLLAEEGDEEAQAILDDEG